MSWGLVGVSSTNRHPHKYTLTPKSRSNTSFSISNITTGRVPGWYPGGREGGVATICSLLNRALICSFILRAAANPTRRICLPQGRLISAKAFSPRVDSCV